MLIKSITDNISQSDGTKRFLGIWDTVLQPGDSVFPHVHETVEEIYYLTEEYLEKPPYIS